jgi:hypothetical protein
MTKVSAAGDLIAKGRLQFDEQQYEESIQTLSAALLRPDNTAEQRVEIYRVLALDYITLGRKDEAENAVRGLLVQRPDYSIPAEESPRFRDFFADARAKWDAEGRPGLAAAESAGKPVVFKHSAPTEGVAGTAIEVRARLVDPDKRTQGIRCFVRAGGKGRFTEIKASLNANLIRFTIPGSSVKPPLVDYYFEALDTRGRMIANQGDANAPLRIAIPERSGGGWVLPVAIGGGVLGAAAVVGALALAGVFKSSSPATSGPQGRPTSTVTITVGDASH